MFGQSLLSAFGIACTTDTDQLFPTTIQANSLATYQLNASPVTSIPSNTYPGTPSNITYTTGKFGDAAVFNGSSSKIDITGQLPTSTTSDYAISCWVNANALGSAGRVIFSNFGAGGSFGTGQAGIYIWNSKLRFYIYSGSGSSFHVYDGSSTISVSYTHLTLPTNREV